MFAGDGQVPGSPCHVKRFLYTPYVCAGANGIIVRPFLVQSHLYTEYILFPATDYFSTIILCGVMLSVCL